MISLCLFLLRELSPFFFLNFRSASVKVDDTSDSEGEQSESGIPSTGHNGPVVRPRKGKKGPFDFEQLRVVQVRFVVVLNFELIRGN